MIADSQTLLETMPETVDREIRNSAGNRRGLAPTSQANLRRGGLEGEPRKTSSDSSATDGGLLQQLRDMRHVYARPASEDRTPGQRICRKWLKSDLTKFMAYKDRLEEKFTKPEELDERFVRLELDSRRNNPNLECGNMLSLVICAGDSNEAFELLFTLDEIVKYGALAEEEGISLWELMRNALNGSYSSCAVSSASPS